MDIKKIIPIISIVSVVVMMIWGFAAGGGFTLLVKVLKSWGMM